MDNKQCCSTDKGSCSTEKKGCCMMKCLSAVVIAFIALFAFDWVFHGQLMMDQYKATASMWRPEAEMQDYMWVCIVTKIVMAGVFACLFCKCCAMCDGCPVAKGMKLGLKLGLLLGACAFSTYAWMPIPMEMAIYWFVGDVAKGIFVGAVLGFFYKLKHKAN
jgi:hypothetical protein